MGQAEPFKPRAIIFDLDGTLIDSCGICIEILEEMLEGRGVRRAIDPQIARPMMSIGGEGMVRALLGEHCGDPVHELADFRDRYSRTPTPVASLYDGVAEGLQALRRAGYELAICSNKPQELCDKVLAETGLAQYFSVVVGSTSALRKKPAPDLLEKVLERLGLAARDCVFVGDSEVDLAVAEQGGMPFHFLTHGYAEQGWLPVAGQIHHHFDQLVIELRGSQAF